MSHDRMLTRPKAASAEDGVARADVPAVDAASNGPPAAAPSPSPGADAVTWAWATEHGPPESASTQQLVSWLARGELAPHTLVWRSGWGEWLPALQVAELAAAFPYVTPGNRRLAQAAPAGSSTTPPPVPVGHCPRLRLLAKDVVGGSAPFTAVSQGLASAPAGRRTLRDLDDVQHDLVTSQVPAAAMLAAARAMKGLGAGAAASGAERWGRLDLGTFGEPPPRRAAGEHVVQAIAAAPRSPSGSCPPGRTLSPHALELYFSALAEPELRRDSGRPRRYGRWLALGLFLGSALGLLALHERPPGAAAAPRASAAGEAARRLPPFRAAETADMAELKGHGEPALVWAPSVALHDGFDRVVFEFRERVPSFHVAYVAGPVRGCSSGEPAPLPGDGWLEVRFQPAYADAASAEPSLATGPLDRAPGTIREVRQTCAVEGVVTWVIRAEPHHRYRAFERSEPARLVVDIER